MKVVVLGGTGTMGGRVVQLLLKAGHETVAASRSAGIDAYTGVGLNEAFAGADSVVDCLNGNTAKAKTSVDFYDTTAKRIIDAAQLAGVGHLVCLSIINARNPQVNKHMGLYQGKAAQEERYQKSKIPTTIVRSTQWFELAEQLTGQMRVGPVAVIPRMQCQPVAADAVARLIVSAVALGVEAPAEVELAGPEPRDLAKLARIVSKRNAALHEQRPHAPVVSFPIPGMHALNGGLLPKAGVPTDPTTFEEWLINDKSA